MNAEWTDSDKPYAAVRAKIDAEIAHGTPAANILNDLEAKCYQPVTGKWQCPNLEGQFAIGYAGMMAYAASDSGTPSSKSGMDALTGLSNTILLHPEEFPHTYNFVRLAFIAFGGDTNGALVKVGEKLVRRDANDRLISGELIYALAASNNISELGRAWDLAKIMLASQPNASSYRLIARVDVAYFNHTNNPRFAQAAIDAYQRAIQLSPSLPGNQADYTRWIGMLQQAMRNPPNKP